ncbi:putative WD domain, G-beta repeat [Lyophyllum shimeji]|uniref:WD domain, G-beta repeat n=1 Tax=Lyophyllum shimeji TaxID=47721 RepID=A0A9P3Q235_LYOSH|nr:putative WD domain, G-beta repeat [Lyophyllum shimeji]
MSASDPLTLPVVTIDPTFPTVIQEVHAGILPYEKFWVSCYKTSHPSVHAKIQAELDERNRDLVLLKAIEGDVAMTRGTDGTYAVSCDPLGIEPTPVLPPAQEYRDPERSKPDRPQRITAFDISPDSTRFATGFLDGSVFLYPILPVSTPSTSASASSADPPIYPAQTITPSPSARPTARPHLSTITHLQFFPSSRVLLTSGADFALSILPADLPEPTTTTTSSVRLTHARTLRAHTRPVTATAILGPGRNVLSASLDATLRLWDVPSSAVIATLHSARAQPILSAVLGPSSSTSPSASTPSSPSMAVDVDGTPAEPAPAPAPDPREVPETQSSTVFVGLQDGTIELFDLRSKRSVFRSPFSPSAGRGGGAGGAGGGGGGGIAALAHSPAHHLLATGSTRGVVSVFDTRNLGAGPVTAFVRGAGGGAGVEDLAFVEDLDLDLGRREGGGVGERAVGLVVATADGLPYIAGVVPEGPGVRAELVGGDCDPVRCVRVRKREANGMAGAGWDVWSAGDDAVVRRWRI